MLHDTSVRSVSNQTTVIQLVGRAVLCTAFCSQPRRRGMGTARAPARADLSPDAAGRNCPPYLDAPYRATALSNSRKNRYAYPIGKPSERSLGGAGEGTETARVQLEGLA